MLLKRVLPIVLLTNLVGCNAMVLTEAESKKRQFVDAARQILNDVKHRNHAIIKTANEQKTTKSVPNNFSLAAAELRTKLKTLPTVDSIPLAQKCLAKFESIEKLLKQEAALFKKIDSSVGVSEPVSQRVHREQCEISERLYSDIEMLQSTLDSI